MGFLACGTTLSINRRRFPAILKEQVWQTGAARGNMRYIRDGKVLCLQWKDNKVRGTKLGTLSLIYPVHDCI